MHVRAVWAKEARALLDGIDVSTLVGLRDRALLGVLVYSFARVSAAVSLRVADYYTQGPRSSFRLHGKGGRYNVVPAHHTAQAYVDAYLEVAGIGEDRRGPLFRSCEPGRRDALQDRAMSRLNALKMIKRRTRKAGLPEAIRNTVRQALTRRQHTWKGSLSGSVPRRNRCTLSGTWS